MDEIEELLPGLEEFLTITLASETLSKFAEERRQFFIERLDIVKLPPTLPPREGRVLAPELLKKTEEESGLLVNHSTPDFAAAQRQISRSLVESHQYQEDVTDAAETSSVQEVKVYDDIDTNESSKEQNGVRQRPISDIQSNKTSDDENEDIQDTAVYEIPMARQQLSAESNNTSYAADGSSNATAGSTEELPDDVLDSSTAAAVAAPPPLPPRRDIKFSDSGSRNSINFDDKPPELPFRPPLPKRSELQAQDKSDRSANSDHELSGDGDSTSYESFDEEVRHDADQVNKLNIQLPKKPVKKVVLRKNKNLSKSRSSSQWEITVPFRKLENVEISGELYYKGKLKWNRRIVAISNGCLAMYKPDKDARPSLVVPLVGYEASINEREGRKGFEVKMVHPNADYHSFSVDFKDWAVLWMEHINGNAKGEPPARFHTHLARTFSGDFDCGSTTNTYGSKSNKMEDHSTELEYDEIDVGDKTTDDIFINEEGDCDSIKSSPVESLFERRSRTVIPRQFQSEKSPRHSKSRTLTHSRKVNPFGLSSRDKTIGATVKDILRRRQKAVYTFSKPEPCVQVEKYTLQGDRSPSQAEPVAPKGPSSQDAPPPAATLSVSSWDWKSVFYNWSTPLDQLILAFRATDLAGSNSNVSTGSEGGSEDSTKSKIRGNKVMRMGSFAFRATQFFENIGKKTIQKKKSHQTSTSNLRHSGGDYPDVRSGIIEESSGPPFGPTSNLARSKRIHTSDSNLPSSFDGLSSSSSLPHLNTGTIGARKHWDGLDDDDDIIDVTHKGYLSVFSNFNRRRWGRRWCLVKENTFECYKTDQSKECELHFLLRPCVLRRATAETNSENGLMIVEAGKEKITVEPLSKEEMGQWVRVLLNETSTPSIPEGLEEFLKDPKSTDDDGASVMSFSVLKQWDMECLVPGRSTLSHDYEDPVETASAAAKLTVSEPETSPDSNTDMNNSSQMSQDATVSWNAENKLNSLSVSSTNKHTTDSGFYSAKGANSDSDSSCGNSPHTVSETDFGFTAQDSRSLFSQHTHTSSRGVSLSPDENSVSGQASFNQHSEPSSFSQSSFSLSSSLKSSSRNSASLDSESLQHNISSFQHGGEESASVCPSSVSSKDGTPEPQSSSDKSKRSGSSLTSSQMILSASGDEYAVVLKRSQQSSKFSESSGEWNSSLSSTLKSRTDLKLEDDVFSENSVGGDISDVNQFTVELKGSNADNDSSFYEPICSPTCEESNNADITSPKASADVNKPDISTSQLSATNTSCDSTDHQPPVPTSPVPELTESALLSHVQTASPGNVQTISSARGGQMESDFSSSCSHVLTGTSEGLTSSTSDVVQKIIKNPSTSLDELNNMMELLKNKHLEIKRRRITIHDKRQKATSDEERLSCEREIASLEKTAESTNVDIRLVQNQLDVVQGKTLEAGKAAQEKKQPGSKKRKTKRKP